MKQQHHTIEIFSANCPLCRHIIDDIQIGKVFYYAADFLVTPI